MAAASLTIAGAASAEPWAKASQSIRELNNYPDAYLEDVGDDGRLHQVIGSWDVGVTPEQLGDPRALAAAARAFVVTHAEAFGGRGDAVPDFEVQGHHATGRGVSVVTVRQGSFGLPHFDTDIVVSFWPDGQLHTLTGSVSIKVQRPDATMTYDQLGEIIELHGVRLPETSPDTVGGFPREVSDNDRIYFEFGLEADGTASWRIKLPEGDFRISDVAGELIKWDSGVDALWSDTTSSCTLRHPDFPRDANSRATSLVANSTSANQTIDCTANSNKPLPSPTCTIEMRRETNWEEHGLERVLDFDGPEQQSGPISCPGSANFTATNGDSEREQAAYWSLWNAKKYITEDVWNQGLGEQSQSLQATHDDTDICGACFRSWNGTIVANATQSLRPSTWMHEYGHYVVWTFGDVSDICSGSNMGDAVDETLADVFAMLVFVNQPGVNPVYGALSGMTAQTPPPHTNAASILSAAYNCTPDPGQPDQHHFNGQKFEQVMWELMFNRNCSNSTCASTSLVGNLIWLGMSHDSVLKRIGGALGSSLDLSPQSTNFVQIRNLFLSDVLSLEGVATRDRVQAVFNHHGG
jgi:hypothetical protein